MLSQFAGAAKELDRAFWYKALFPRRLSARKAVNDFATTAGGNADGEDASSETLAADWREVALTISRKDKKRFPLGPGEVFGSLAILIANRTAGPGQPQQQRPVLMSFLLESPTDRSPRIISRVWPRNPGSAPPPRRLSRRARNGLRRGCGLPRPERHAGRPGPRPRQRTDHSAPKAQAAAGGGL
jgi:hypothetical protein